MENKLDKNNSIYETSHRKKDKTSDFKSLRQ